MNCSRTPDRTFTEDSPPEPLAGTLGYSTIKRAAEALVGEYARVRPITRLTSSSECIVA